MKTIRIGSGAGYSDDRLEPALEIMEKGNVDYIVFECLAERTIAIAQQRKMKNPDEGYDKLLAYRMERVLPLCSSKKVKVVTNMGAANPVAAAKLVKEMAEAQNMSGLKIAAVVGDDVFSEIDYYSDASLLENGRKINEIRSSIVSANAYIGAAGIAEALDNGADIVITGRASDPSLFLGPLIHEFGWSMDDANLMGIGTMAGHLMECGAQVTGGYFADPGYKDVPELWNVGFPILEIDEEGELLISKLKTAGGMVSESTVKEQLLYEIHDPANYLTPDVIADFSQAEVYQVEKDVVKVSGGSGKAKSGYLKTSIGYKEGYLAEGEISYGGAGSIERAELAREIISKRLELANVQIDEIRYDFIGQNSLYKGALSDRSSAKEVRLRVAARTVEPEDAKVVIREVEALYTNGPAGGGGIRTSIKDIVSIGSILIPESQVSVKVFYSEVL
ncbi:MULTISPECIES: acyclic terpene utilization AtuA family protein [unclassified Planococcus (in: firmicutes)]|uniref:acyclic terpene utilization AtuA family protein n=1 Tax=unclassified Planococcus (in: firmicutes) TaxID=2662419 RepID=UPI000C3444DF|nr:MULTISPECIES: acyclic terpene utilization AtuA family protein [unclassified Planococcus (in: firmicutes)]AUD13099.1 ABC transporter substrate-binding protein [Planococcus sp. MB-3u-03]PKG45418.1 ABC transporter substrate-binding protein [Planococcus sp. Urea-trap-24]PKG88986.1 ABC transporter substrate-binding protein [Planococcus sp. Urea-3u-39]PKH36354.1 ABC transporter substrate-binding protein [Planococcus sp. MB-3u-09]